MPDIDLSDLLYDTDIAGQSITIIRSQRTVVNGMTHDAPSTIVTTGSIQPASGSSLMQFPEDQRTTSMYDVVTPIRLIPLSRSNAPDIVVINGQNYRVMTTRDFMDFGAGICRATVQLIDTALTVTG